MARKVFKSKVDWWIRLILVLTVALEVVVMGAVIADASDPKATTITILVCILTIALIVWLLLGTAYTVDRGVLTVRSGPFRWKVPLEEITAVEPTRSPLSSPALSLDRIRIRYRKRRRIMVSPADKEGFLKAISRDLKRVEDS